MKNSVCLFVYLLCVCVCMEVFACSCVCLSVDPSECVFILAVQYAEALITYWGITTEPDDMAGRCFFSGPNSSPPARVKARKTSPCSSLGRLVHSLSFLKWTNFSLHFTRYTLLLKINLTCCYGRREELTR